MTATSSACALCTHEIRGDPRRGPRGVLVCRRCHGCSVTIRTADSERLDDPRVRTFYVSSFRRAVPGVVNLTDPKQYVVKRIGRARMTCTCDNYVHVRQMENDVCKHVRLVRLFIRAAGGIGQVTPGLAVPFRIAEPARRAR